MVAGASPAAASEIVVRDAKAMDLTVDGRGRAVVHYTFRGARKHALYWGALNARKPARGARQVAFKKDYSGGWGSFRTQVWRQVKGCGKYTGPPLPFLVKACTAPDGTHWALQKWQRMLPNYGFSAWKPEQNVQELHLSHWKGNLPVLEVYLDWSWSGRFHHLFGRFSYGDGAVHGFSSTQWGSPTDTFGRNVYLDTLNSDHGPGWRRENSFLAHVGGGNFCYSFVNQTPPPYYPGGGAKRPSGAGEQYRLSAMGPGVTPIVQWTGAGLADYDKNNPAHVAHEDAMNALGDQVAANDTLCKQH